MKRITGSIIAYSSRRDIYGNKYWAFVFTSNEGKEVCGKINGGRGNIYAVRMVLNGGGEWDKGIHFHENELKIREFNNLVKNWPYAGCTPKELSDFIRKGLGKS